MSNNYRCAMWSDIVCAIEVRCKENDDRLQRCKDPDVAVILTRIANDDIERLKVAQRWVEYHRS